MRFRLSITTIIATLIVCTHQARGQSPDQRNAATWYQRAIEQWRQLPQEQREMLSEYDRAQPPTPEVRAIVQRLQPILESVRQGSLQEYCDYNLDRSQGFELLLPHLGEMRGLARAMAADAAVRLHEGDPTAAANRIAQMYQMSTHFGDDRILISSLVGQAVFALADATTQQALDRGQFEAQHSDILLEGLARLDEDDPFDYLEAVAGEQEVMVGYVADKIENPGGLAPLLSLVGPDVNPRMAGQLLMLDADGLRAAVEGYDAALSRGVEIVSMDDPVAAAEAMREFEAQLQQGMHGPLAAMLMPAIGKVLEQRAKAEQMLADRKATLRALSTGDAQPDDLANAAVWYLRAIDMLEKVDLKTLDMMREPSAQRFNPPVDPQGSINRSPDAQVARTPDPLDLALSGADLQSIIAVVREGTQKRRCDFTGVIGPRSGDRMIPAYVPGINDLFRLLQADAVRLIKAGDASQATDRLATGVRLSGHVSVDPVILSNLVAHVQFNHTIDLVSQALENKRLADEHKSALADALERMPRRDPFGYIGSIVKARERLAHALAGSSPKYETFEARRERARDICSEFTGDQLLMIIAALERMEHNAAVAAVQRAVEQGGARVEALPDPAAAVSRLLNVISRQELEIAESRMTLIAPLLADDEEGEYEPLHDVPVAKIAQSSYAAGLSDHLRRARADLRRAQSMLAPEGDPAAQENEPN